MNRHGHNRQKVHDAEAEGNAEPQEFEHVQLGPNAPENRDQRTGDDKENEGGRDDLECGCCRRIGTDEMASDRSEDQDRHEYGNDGRRELKAVGRCDVDRFRVGRSQLIHGAGRAARRALSRAVTASCSCVL